MIASQVTIVEIAPVMARPPVEKIAPINGVMRVVPQVGQPAPSAMRPVIMPAFSIFSEFLVPFSRFLLHSSTINPINVPCNKEIRKIGNQSKNGWLKPKMLIKLSPSICSPLGKPKVKSKLILEVPPDNKFIKKPKNKNAGTKPNQKRFSLVASKIPLPAKANSSSHFLQFI